MKKIILIPFVLIICITTSFAKLVSKEACGIMTVSTKFYKVKFFPKYMFPYEIEISGKKVKPEFFDSLYLKKNKTRYLLNEDRYAEIKLISDNDDTVVIQTIGTYCYNNSTAALGKVKFTVAPGKVKVVYTYRFIKTSPIIDVSAVVARSDNTQWTELRFLQLRFKTNPFSTLLNYKTKSAIALTKKNKDEEFCSPRWSVFSADQIALGVIGKSTLAGYDFKKSHCFYLGQSVIKDWTSRKIKLSGKLYLGPAKNKNEYDKLFKPFCGNL